ncbi:MAG: DUF4079 family protein [Myxococcota bacterium]
MDDAIIVRTLAFVHPAWMVASLAMAIWTARLGLEIRRRHRIGQAVGSALRRRHLRSGKRAIAMVAFGFMLGPTSMLFLRDQNPFDSFHGILGVIVLGLFIWTGWSGRSLAAGQREARNIHRIAAASSLAAAMFAAVAGFILLP